MAAENHKYVYDPDPSLYLIENMDLLPKKGRALDIAMGEGRNALYLAGSGYEVDGIDRSPEAVRKALQLAREKGLTIKGSVGDLEKDYHITEDHYDLIICFNYLQRSLAPQIIAGLKKGGFLVYETYLIDQQIFSHPRNPDFLLGHNELLDLFRELRVLRYREGLIEPQKFAASLIAEKV
jgi:tellurite methyltransferase